MIKRLELWAILALLFIPVMVMAAASEEAAKETTELSEASPDQPPADNSLSFLSDLDTPPFAFVENFKNTGFEIDLGEAIGKELGRPVKSNTLISRGPIFAPVWRWPLPGMWTGIVKISRMV